MVQKVYKSTKKRKSCSDD